ncbi:MAG: hypothetical protein PUP92_06510 [Rhizonema sp. PD38]|nr:hypothetical protein [Rhizonema sp. PD38]
MKGAQLLGWIEQIVIWSLTGLLFFVGLGSFPVNPTSFFDFAASFYYLVVAVIICPKTPLSFNKRLIFGFIAFLCGMWVGLI